MAYGIFADFYDRFTENVDYALRCDYLLELFERYDRRPTLLLDLACGTGGFSFAFEKRGMEVIGVDLSPDMLSVAQNKAFEQNSKALFVCQNAAELELYSTVDGAVCCLDSINHITDENELAAAFARVAQHLEPGRLFIFDVNSLYKHREILADNAFVYEDEGVLLAWQNELVDGRDVNIYLDFFVEAADGRYTRYSEEFTERGYSDAQLRKMLTEAGFQTQAVLGDLTDAPPTDTCDRWIYVARRV